MRVVIGLMSLLLSAESIASPLEVSSEAGTVSITAAVVGSDLRLLAESEEAVMGLLSAKDPIISFTLDLDTDCDAKTGRKLENAVRGGTDYSALRGADYTLTLIFRHTASKDIKGAPQEAVLVKEEGMGGPVVKTNTRLTVDGNRIQVLIPLEALGLRAGKKIRLVAHSGGFYPADETITLAKAEAKAP